MSPLTRWGKYDEQRQDLMKAELNRILETENLSENVFEIVSKGLKLVDVLKSPSG